MKENKWPSYIDRKLTFALKDTFNVLCPQQGPTFTFNEKAEQVYREYANTFKSSFPDKQSNRKSLF